MPDPRAIMLPIRLTWGILLLAMLLVGCTELATSPAGDRMRIVTLAPALTRMVVDLDLEDQLVGVAENDMAAPRPLPVAGTYTDVDTERLIALQPTHVLMTIGKEGVPDRLHDLAEAGRFELVAYPNPLSVEDVVRTLHDPDNPQSLGFVLGVPERAAALRRDLIAALQAIRDLTSRRPPTRVLVVIGTGPLMASGPGTVHDELLAYAGGTNAAAGAAVTAPTYDREALLALNPQAIIILSPGASEAAPQVPELAGLPIAAVRDDRITVLNDPLAMLPSTSLPRITARIAAALHPDLRPAIEAILEAPRLPPDVEPAHAEQSPADAAPPRPSRSDDDA